MQVELLLFCWAKPQTPNRLFQVLLFLSFLLSRGICRLCNETGLQGSIAKHVGLLVAIGVSLSALSTAWTYWWPSSRR